MKPQWHHLVSLSELARRKELAIAEFEEREHNLHLHKQMVRVGVDRSLLLVALDLSAAGVGGCHRLNHRRSRGPSDRSLLFDFSKETVKHRQSSRSPPSLSGKVTCVQHQQHPHNTPVAAGPGVTGALRSVSSDRGGGSTVSTESAKRGA